MPTILLCELAEIRYVFWSYILNLQRIKWVVEDELGSRRNSVTLKTHNTQMHRDIIPTILNERWTY